MEDSAYLFTVYAVFFLAATLFSLLVNSIFLRFAQTLGIRDRESTMIRWSSESKPAFGGIGFFIIFLLSVACYSVFFDANSVFHDKQTLGVLTCASLAFLMGLADDAYNTRPILKFSVQTLCGVVLIATGTQINLFEALWLNYTVTIFWTIGIMNSINMLDNMDAITSVVAIFIVVTALVSFAATGAIGSLSFMMGLGVLAALIGFLFFNWHPSKMFMGDTGSQLLGVFLAAIGIQAFWNFTGVYEEPNGYRQFCLAVLAFLPTLCDTTIATVNRLARGQSPLKGGKDHTTHHLSYLGLTDSQIAMVFTGICFVSLIISIFILKFIERWNNAYTLFLLGYFSIVLIALFIVTRFNKNQR